MVASHSAQQSLRIMNSSQSYTEHVQGQDPQAVPDEFHAGVLST